MILFLQYTIADTRYFGEKFDHLLPKPLWPSPSPFGEFVRAAGAIIERKRQGQPSWVGENFICKISKGIKIDQRLSLKNDGMVKNVSKHLYANEGYVMAKYEFVFNIKLPGVQPMVGFDLLKDIIEKLLESKVRVKLGKTYEEVGVDQLGKALRSFHYLNTTNTKGQDFEGDAKSVVSCIPQLYFYLDRHETAANLRGNFTKILDKQDLAILYGAWHKYHNNGYRVWVHVRYPGSASAKQHRALRMSIMRLHSEYECLNVVIQRIARGDISVQERSLASDHLQSYFKLSINTYLKEQSNLDRAGTIGGFADYFSKVFAKSQPGKLEQIRERIQTFNFRPAVNEKVFNFITNNYEYMDTKFENHNSTILSQGNNNTVQNNTVQQAVNSSLSADEMTKLIEELGRLTSHAQANATTTDERKAVVALSEAEESAKKKDVGGVVSALKSGGKWVLDLASKLGTSVLLEVIKAHHLI